MGTGDKAYSPERDGSLDKFLARFEYSSYPLFRGAPQYRLLWSEGLLHPDLSLIRINNADNGEHEHYSVVDGELIAGVTGLRAYNGVTGTHAVDAFLRGPREYFEAHNVLFGEDDFREELRRQRRR